MEVISLNIWSGRAGTENLLKFFAAHADVDIFCLQEVWSAPHKHLEGRLAGGVLIDNEKTMAYGLQSISEVLDTHTPYFRPHLGDNFGLLTLVKKNISVCEEGDVFVYKERGYVSEGDIGNHARPVQYVTFETSLGKRTVMNFHGLWNGKGKGDCLERLEQSDNIIRFLKRLSHPYILCGDFNLLPETESLKKFEEFGLRNLITEFGITSTRTSLYTKPEKFADYTLVSAGITVKEFKILPEEVSDHSPMYLKFE